MSSSASPGTVKFETWRLMVVFTGILVVLVLLIARLLSLQVFGSQQWTDLAIENYTKNISTAAVRGIIYDRNGSILARNVASYNIAITPAYLPDDDADVQRIIGGLRDHLIGGDGREGVRSFDGNLYEVKPFVLKKTDMVSRAFHQSLRGWGSVFF